MADQKYVLIVDDEPALRDSLSAALTDLYTVKTASDGIDGIALALGSHPDLIILDYMMPRMNGIEVLEKLRADEWGKNVPVIFATNTYDVAAINTVMAHDVKDYLIKADISVDALRNQIASHIG